MTTQLRLNPNLLKVPLYIAGKSVEEVQEEYGLDDVVKLASNEDALGPSPLAVEAARRALSDAASCWWLRSICAPAWPN